MFNECRYIWYTQDYTLRPIFYTISAVYSFIKVLIDMNNTLRACLHGGGGPQIGEVTCGGSRHLSCKRDQIDMRLYGQVSYLTYLRSPTSM